MKIYDHSSEGGNPAFKIKNPVVYFIMRVLVIIGLLMFFSSEGMAAKDVSYNANGATSGTVPATVPYNNNNIVTVSSNSGNLVKTGYSFVGWSTSSNGTGTTYLPGNTFSMGTSAIELFAKWGILNYKLVVDSVIVNEAVGNAIVNIRIDPAISPYDTVSVQWATSNVTAVAGSDYTTSNGTLNITSINNTVSIPITNTAGYEPQEFFNIVLSSPSITTTSGSTVAIENGTGDVTINDNNINAAPTLSVDDLTVAEGAGSMTFRVTRSGANTSAVNFSYTTSDYNASQGKDYTLTAGGGTIAAGADFVDIPVPIIDDLMAGEGSETFFMTISNPSSGTIIGDGIGKGTIIDNDSGFTLAINDAQIAESDSNITANVNLVLSYPAPAGGIVVTYHTTNGTATAPADYTALSVGTTITIPEGNITFPIPVVITGDDIAEVLEDFNITIESATSPNTAIVVAYPSGKVTVFDDDGLGGGCSSYVGLMTINEYQNNPNYTDSTHPLATNGNKVPGNYIEVKYLDLLVRQFITDAWTISVFTTAGTDTLTWNESDSDCHDPRYDIFEMSNNIMGARGYVVIKDQNGNEVDVLNIDSSSHYSQNCQDFLYDTNFTSSAQNKDLFRDPDGTGDWYDHGNGANSGGSRCINRDGAGGEVVYTIFDAIDTDVTLPPIPANANFILKTRVVSKPSDIKIVSLDVENSVPNNPLISITASIKAYLVEDVTLNRIDPTTTYDVVFNNVSSVTLTGTSFTKARKRVRMQFEYCEIGGVVQNSTECWSATTNQATLDQRRIAQSRDTFAIRPNDFNSTITANPQFIAGQAASITFRADKFGGTGTVDYNETENTSFVVDVNISDSSKTCAQPAINFAPPINFTDGNVTDDYALHNVGYFNVTIHEKNGGYASANCNTNPEYARIDCDDTPDIDRLITPYTQQIKVLPHHFDIDGNLSNGSTGFTYLNNFEGNASLDQNISALLSWDVIAKGETNVTTTNYTNTCYAKDGNITLTLALSQTILDLNASLTKLLWYDANNTLILSTTPIEGPYLLPRYTKDRFITGDSNGTGNFTYRLNFDRNVTKVVNPFFMSVTNLQVDDNNSVTGNDALDNHATYVYGSTYAGTQRYDSPTGTANIYYAIYCYNISGGSSCNPLLLPSTNRTSDSRWFQNSAHNESTDGNITTVDEKNLNYVTATDYPSGVPAATTTITYSDQSPGYPYKTTMQNGANTWLIYNKDNPAATKNEFKVHFSKIGVWSGKETTDTKTDGNTTAITNRRSMW